MPVHIYGQPAANAQDSGDCTNPTIWLPPSGREDCSQAHGAEINGQKVGTFADISAYSCYPTKNLGGTGDGGVILCRSERVCRKD